MTQKDKQQRLKGSKVTEMNKILVICTGNTCRSPMAEGIINKIIADNKIEDVVVESMGLSAYDGDAASAYAIEALEEIGIDIKNHRSKRVMLQDIYDADCIYVMTLQHKNVIIEACNDCEIEKKIIVMEISDPFGQELDRYRQCRNQMMTYFEKELRGE